MLKWSVAILMGVVTVLFLAGLERNGAQPLLAWLVPMILLILVAINSFWFTRVVSWTIFAVGFFALLAVLSAFTLRFRTETGFNAMPLYRALGMYAGFIYISLGQIKQANRRLLGGSLNGQEQTQNSITH